MLNVGIKYDPWIFTDELGSGSFGTVYRIEREDFGVKVDAALKVIPIPQSKSEVKSIRSQGMTEEEVTQYFYGVAEEVVKEFQLMFQLKGHTNIVSYEDHEIREHDDGVGYDIIIRMELLDPLDEFCSQRVVTQQGVAKLGMDICRALERCHSLGIVHRDIKPSNIFVSKQGDFKLGDFGIARKMENQTAELSRKGTFGFMAPEVAAAKRYDFSVDTYSLGLVMYKLLNGNRLPFMPPAGQPIMPSDQSNATVRRLSGEPLPKPTNACDALAEVVLKASAFDPRDRYQTAEEFRTAIKQALPEIQAADEANKELNDENPTILLAGDDAFASGSSGSFDSLDNEIYPTTLLAEDYAPQVEHRPTTQNAKESTSDEGEYPTTLLSDEYDSGEEEYPTTLLADDKVFASGNSKTTALDALVEASSDQDLTTVITDNFIGEEPSGASKEDEPGSIKEIEEDAPTITARAKAKATAGKKDEKPLKETKPAKPSENAKTADDKKPNKIVIAAVAAVAVVIIIIAAIFGMQPAPEPEAPAPQMAEVPIVKGMTEEEAATTLTQAGFSPAVSHTYSADVAKGLVISQDVTGEADEGSKVSFVVSDGVEQASVPDVKGMSKDEAKKALEAAGLTATFAKGKYSSKIAKGSVINQSVKAGTQVDKGSKVKLTPSLGEKPKPEPEAPTENKPSTNTKPNYNYKPSTPSKPSAPSKPSKPSGGSDADINANNIKIG